MTSLLYTSTRDLDEEVVEGTTDTVNSIVSSTYIDLTTLRSVCRLRLSLNSVFEL